MPPINRTALKSRKMIVHRAVAALVGHGAQNTALRVAEKRKKTLVGRWITRTGDVAEPLLSRWLVFQRGRCHLRLRLWIRTERRRHCDEPYMYRHSDPWQVCRPWIFFGVLAFLGGMLRSGFKGPIYARLLKG